MEITREYKSTIFTTMLKVIVNEVSAIYIDELEMYGYFIGLIQINLLKDMKFLIPFLLIYLLKYLIRNK